MCVIGFASFCDFLIGFLRVKEYNIDIWRCPAKHEELAIVKQTNGLGIRIICASEGTDCCYIALT